MKKFDKFLGQIQKYLLGKEFGILYKKEIEREREREREIQEK